MRRQQILTLIALALASLGIGFGLYQYSQLPTTLTLAVGPAGRETHRYAEAVAQAGIDAREPVRLKVVVTGGANESARLMESGKVDLAIIRSDYDLPNNAQSILVNTKRFVVVMAPQRARSSIQRFTDLKGKRIAVARLTDPNLPLVRRMLAVADIGENDATLIEADLAELPELLGTGKVDAAIAVVVPSSPVFTALVPEIARRLPGGLRIVPLDEAQAIANRITGVEIAEIPVGAFGAKRPAEEISTVAISYRTVARASMSDELAGRAAQSLYGLRARLTRIIPIAFTAEPPDGTEGAKLPVHPGAMAYFEGETKTFYERYGEILFTGLWGATILGSGLAGFLAWVGRRRHSETTRLIEEVATLTATARAAGTADEIAAIEARADAIVADVAAGGHQGDVSSEALEAFGLALEHLRSAIEQARARA